MSVHLLDALQVNELILGHISKPGMPCGVHSAGIIRAGCSADQSGNFRFTILKDCKICKENLKRIDKKEAAF